MLPPTHLPVAADHDPKHAPRALAPHVVRAEPGVCCFRVEVYAPRSVQLLHQGGRRLQRCWGGPQVVLLAAAGAQAAVL